MHKKLLPTIAAIGFVTVLAGCQQSAPTPPADNNNPPLVGAGEHCGGNMMNAPECMAGFHCQASAGSNAAFGDVGGTCVAN